jgi:hypothetical protein
MKCCLRIWLQKLRLAAWHGYFLKGKGRELLHPKNAGLKVVTLIATLNPVSQVLW